MCWTIWDVRICISKYTQWSYNVCVYIKITYIYIYIFTSNLPICHLFSFLSNTVFIYAQIFLVYLDLRQIFSTICNTKYKQKNWRWQTNFTWKYLWYTTFFSLLHGGGKWNFTGLNYPIFKLLPFLTFVTY